MKKITTSILSVCLLLITLTINAQTFTNYTTTDGLPHNNVLCLAQDTSGNMWFGTQDGVVKFDGVSSWTIYNTTTHSTLAANTIAAIAVDRDNNIWVGTDFGVSVYDGSTFTTYTTADGLGNNRINHIAQAANGDVWIGDFSGATLYDGSTFTAYGTTDGIPFGGITYVDFDSNGDVYMASGLGGVIQYDGTTFTVHNTGLESNVVRSIAVDASDNKWVGTAKGISVLNSSNVVVDAHTIMLVLPAPDTLNPVEDIKINSQGDVWTGIYVDYLVTEGGVAVNNGGSSWSDYDVSDGLVGPVIRKITIDKMDNVWVGTSSGISKISFPTSINNVNFAANNFNVYPNPATDVLNIRIENGQAEQSIEVYSSTMQKVREFSLNQSQNYISVSVSDMDKGMYFVKYGNQISKLVVN
jgi:ligand-binding sensor domain-containing protein